MSTSTPDAPADPPASLEELCSLSPDQLEARKAMVKREIAPHVLEREVLADGLSFAFEKDAEMRAKLEQLAALESQCCQPLRFAVREAGGTLRLDILGADPASGFFDELSLGAKTGGGCGC